MSARRAALLASLLAAPAARAHGEWAMGAPCGVVVSIGVAVAIGFSRERWPVRLLLIAVLFATHFAMFAVVDGTTFFSLLVPPLGVSLAVMFVAWGVILMRRDAREDSAPR